MHVNLYVHKASCTADTDPSVEAVRSNTECNLANCSSVSMDTLHEYLQPLSHKGRMAAV